jgi:hypothetical protein
MKMLGLDLDPWSHCIVDVDDSVAVIAPSL